MATRLSIFTIGHSNHSVERFVELLEAHHINLIVDVRSHPHSRFAPHFNRESLKHSLASANRAYRFLGAELGGRPEGSAFYDDEGHVLYGKVAETDAFAAGINRVETDATGHRVALMCSEEDPSGCHRRLLVSRVLRDRGVTVIHIRGNGSLVDENDLISADQARSAQTSLFDQDQEDAWRSIQSVSPRRALKTSSSS